MLNITWPWQWKKIATDTLTQLQDTRAERDRLATDLAAREQQVIRLEARAGDAERQLAEARKQVQAMSHR